MYLKPKIFQELATRRFKMLSKEAEKLSKETENIKKELLAKIKELDSKVETLDKKMQSLESQNKILSMQLQQALTRQRPPRLNIFGARGATPAPQGSPAPHVVTKNT